MGYQYRYNYSRHRYEICHSGLFPIAIGNYEITAREAIFSITIASIMTVLGFFLSDYVDKCVHDSQLRFREAAQIENSTDEFKQALLTDVGDAFVEGDFLVDKPVVHDKLDGEWLSIRSDYQTYTMHTRIVTYTTGSGKTRTTHTRTEHYWTWDTTKTEFIHTDSIIFSNVRFSYKKFDYSDVKVKEKTVGNGYHKRIVFHYLPTSFHGTTFTTIGKNTISDKSSIHYEKNLQNTYDDCITSHASVFFWIGWIGFTAIVVYGFVALENRWLED